MYSTVRRTEGPEDLGLVEGDGTEAVRVALQGIHTADGRVVAYELLFRAASTALTADLGGGDEAAQDRATAQVIVTTFGDFGRDDLAGDKALFLNATRAFLTGALPLPVAPGDVVLEVLETTTVDDEVLAGLQALRRSGYVLAVDDFDGEVERLPVVRMAEYVKIDLQVTAERLAEVVALVREVNPRARVVAERVETPEQFQTAREAGADLFQGWFFHRPAVVEKQAMTPVRVNCLQLLTALHDDAAPVGVLVDHLDRDPALSLRILRTVGSATYAPTGGITSVLQAVVLLGRNTLADWVTLVLLGSTRGYDIDPRDELLRIFARAEVCRALSPDDPDAAHLVGLLSGAAQAIGADVEDVVGRCALTAPVREALLHGHGPLGEVLRVAVGHELPGEGEPDPAVTATSQLWLAAVSEARSTIAALRRQGG